MLTKGQYCEMVEKLAGEAIEDQEERIAEAQAAEMIEKAAMVYDFAINKMAAAEEVFAEAEGHKDECLEVLASAGLLDEDGINKEAAEEDEEVLEATLRLAQSHDEALEKMAEAEEVYVEAEMERQAAEEVLNYFGIEI